MVEVEVVKEEEIEMSIKNSREKDRIEETEVKEEVELVIEEVTEVIKTENLERTILKLISNKLKLL